MIRVLHILPSLNITSGVTKVIMNYYKRIDRNRFQFDFLYLFISDENYTKEIEKLGGKTYFIGNPKKIIVFNRKINTFIKQNKNKYSIIHLHMPFLSTIFYPIKKRINAKAFVIHAHSTKYGNSTYTNIRNKILYDLSPYEADCYFACSTNAGKKIFKSRYKNKGFFMFNIIDYDIDEIENKKADNKPLIDNKTIIGHVGSFYYPKNHKYIIKIFNEYKKINNNSILILIGEGYLKNKIINYSKKLGIYDSIIFLEKQKNINLYYKKMDIFILPSKFEGFSLALLEAQANNLSCVVSDVVPDEALIKKENISLLSIKEKPVVWAKEIEKRLTIKTIETSSNQIEAFIDKSVKELENKYNDLAK